MLSKKNIFIAAIVALFFANLAFAAPNNQGNKSVLVEIAKVELKPFHKQLTVTGSLRAHQGIMVRPETAGRITQIYFKSGDTVQAGTPLVQLYKNEVEAKLQQSQAELQLAKQNYARMTTLHKTHVISEAEFDDVASKFNAANGKAAEYQSQLEQTLIRAPFNGRLGLSAVSLGDYVNIGQNLVSLQMIDPIEVEFNVAETYLSNIAVNQNVMAVSRAYPNQTFTGTIYAIDAEINVNNRSVAVRATIPNMNNKLLPGGFVEVNLDLTGKEPSLIIPQVAVFYDVGQANVYKIVGNKALKTKIKLGERDQENVVVVEGLNVNDVVVSAGQLNLEDGAMVKY